MLPWAIIELVLIILGPWCFSEFRKYYIARQRLRTEGRAPQAEDGGANSTTTAMPSPSSSTRELLLFSLLCASTLYHISRIVVSPPPNVFLALGLDITTPTGEIEHALRRRMPEGRLNEAQEILVGRLKSWDARKNYLVLGQSPLLECFYCSTSTDFLYYRIPRLLLSYVFELLLLGLLTSSAPLVSTPLSVRGIAGSPAQHQAGMAPQRRWWRKLGLVLLAGMAVGETWLLATGASYVIPKPTRLNMWDTNINLLRRLLFFSLNIVIYFFPSRLSPSPHHSTTTASLSRLSNTNGHLESLFGKLRAVELSRLAVWSEPKLRYASAAYHDTRLPERSGSSAYPRAPPAPAAADAVVRENASDDEPPMTEDGPAPDPSSPLPEVDEEELEQLAALAGVDLSALRDEAKRFADKSWRQADEVVRLQQTQETRTAAGATEAGVQARHGGGAAAFASGE